MPSCVPLATACSDRWLPACPRAVAPAPQLPHTLLRGLAGGRAAVGRVYSMSMCRGLPWSLHTHAHVLVSVRAVRAASCELAIAASVAKTSSRELKRAQLAENGGVGFRHLSRFSVSLCSSEMLQSLASPTLNASKKSFEEMRALIDADYLQAARSATAKQRALEETARLNGMTVED